MSRLRFWLRWSLRDLRERWLLVVAIALTIAIGTGGFAGMISTTQWRQDAIDASVEKLAMHDLRLELAEGAAVPAGSLRALVDALDDPTAVAAASERLVVPVAVDASAAGKTILVPGSLIGVELADGGPPVDRVAPDVGRALVAADDVIGEDDVATVALEYRFGRYHGLAPEGSLVVAGRPARYVGQASTPEMFVVMTEGGGMMAEAGFAGVFAGLATAQDLAGMPGLVNDLVVRLRPGADREAVAVDLARAAAGLPGVGSRVLTRDDDPAYKVIVGDIETDGQFFAIFAVLILLGAAFATFNLVSRIVEAQRRQIGIGMALGVPGRQLAVRPLLVGAEIATLGVLLGIPVGLAFDAAMLDMLVRLMPLPVFEAPLLPGPFLIAAAVGFLVPFVATLLPVRRAIRMVPVEAIHAGPRAVRGSGLAGLANRLPLPGGTLGRAPVRNVLRAPRRSLLTALGIAGAISVLVGMSAMMDTFEAAIRTGERETLGGHPDRMTVELAGFLPASLVTAALADEPTVGYVSPGLRVGAVAVADGREVELLLDLVDTGAERVAAVGRRRRAARRAGRRLRRDPPGGGGRPGPRRRRGRHGHPAPSAAHRCHHRRHGGVAGAGGRPAPQPDPGPGVPRPRRRRPPRPRRDRQHGGRRAGGRREPGRRDPRGLRSGPASPRWCRWPGCSASTATSWRSSSASSSSPRSSRSCSPSSSPSTRRASPPTSGRESTPRWPPSACRSGGSWGSRWPRA